MSTRPGLLLNDREAAILRALRENTAGLTRADITRAVFEQPQRGDSAGIKATLNRFSRQGLVEEMDLTGLWTLLGPGTELLERFQRPRPSLTTEEVLLYGVEMLSNFLHKRIGRKLNDREKGALLHPLDDGYSLAKRLEGVGWEADAKLVSLLNSARRFFRESLARSRRRWVIETGQKPALSVDDVAVLWWADDPRSPGRFRLHRVRVERIERDGTYGVVFEDKDDDSEVTVSWESVDPLHDLFSSSPVWGSMDGQRTAIAWGVDGEGRIHFSWASGMAIGPATTTGFWPPHGALTPLPPPWPWCEGAPRMPPSVEALLCPQADLRFSDESLRQTVIA